MPGSCTQEPLRFRLRLAGARKIIHKRHTVAMPTSWTRIPNRLHAAAPGDERGDGRLAQVGPNGLAVGTQRALASHSWSRPPTLAVTCCKQECPTSEPAKHALNKTPYVFLRWLETRVLGMDESMRVQKENGPAPRGLNAVAIIQEPAARADGRSTRG